MYRFKRRPLAAAVITLFSTSQLALAQSQTQREQTLPEVKVQGAQDSFKDDSTRSATRTETPMRDIPQFINSVPQTLIRSQGATTLQDALRNVPGISYGAAEGGTQANQVFFLRGFPMNQDLFIDGVRDLGEYNRDLFATESVEVLKGSSALMFGRGSTGGLINQTPKTADLLQRKEVGLTLGSFDQRRLTGDLNLRLGEGDSGAFRVVALAEDSGNYRYPQGVEKYGIAPSLWLKASRATELTFSYYYLNEKSVTDYGQPTKFFNNTFYGFAPVSARTYYGFENNDYAHYQTNIATFKIDHRFSDALSLRNTLRWAKYERQSESTLAQGVTNNPATTPESLLTVARQHDQNRTRDNDDSALINQTELTWKLATGSVKHTVLAGLELARERLNRWNYTLDASAAPGVQAPAVTSPLLSPDPKQTLNYSKTPNLRSTADGDTVAVYVQDQIEMTKQWKAVLGLRWERFESSAENTVIGTANPATVASGPFGRTDNMLSGRAGLIWQPTSRQSYYVSYGNSYNPSGELGVYGGTAATNLSAVNQNVEPEKSRNFEIGAQWDVFTGLQLRSSLFRNEKENARIVDPTGTTTLGGKRRVDGIEFEAAGALTPNWDIYSGIAFMDGKIVTGFTGNPPNVTNLAGRTPLGVADVAGNVWTVYRLGGGWEIGGGVRGQRGTWLTDLNNPGSEIPSYLLVDATVAYVQKKYEVRLNGYNLGDKLYYMGGYNNNANRVLPGQPRAGSVTVRFNFD